MNTIVSAAKPVRQQLRANSTCGANTIHRGIRRGTISYSSSWIGPVPLPLAYYSSILPVLLARRRTPEHTRGAERYSVCLIGPKCKKYEFQAS